MPTRTDSPHLTHPEENRPLADPLAVCDLPPEGRAERLTWIRDEILPHAVATERGASSVAWELDDAPGLAAKLDVLVERERACCSGITFRHRPSVAAGRLRLEVLGVDPDATVFAPLHVEGGAPARLGGRVASAAGVGTLLGILVCCALPIAAASLFGAAAAAPFATLDQPWIIAGAALLFGGATFAWQSRRRAAQAPDVACGPSG